MNKVKMWFKRLGNRISDKFTNFINFFKVSNTNTRASMCLMGLGQLMYKQIGKGILYLLIEIMFILFFTLFGFSWLVGLITLGTVEADPWTGTEGDNSVIFLLLGIFSVFILILFIFLYISNVRDANDTDKASIEELFSGNLHININGEQHDVKIMIKRENVTSAYSGDEMTIYMTTDPLTSRGKAVVYRCVYVNDNGVWKRDGVMTEGTATVCDYTFGSSWGTGSFNTNTWAAS